MKKDIHPQYFPKAKITCACGNVFEIGSTKESIEVEICSMCHPFYTGVARIVDTAGRVEKFRTRQAKAGSVKTPKEKESTKKTDKVRKTTKKKTKIKSKNS